MPIDTMSEITWHFPRNDLADAYLAQFRTGLTHSITLFAPRRKGKTEFLLEDLAPAAEDEGYKVCYVSLWALKSDPAAALLAGLVDAGQKQTMWQRAKQLLKTPIRSLDGEASIGGATVSVGAELAGDKPAAEADLIEIPRALDNLVRQARNGKVLLLLDEVQFLAKPAHDHLVSSLRTALDTRKASVRTVFTGSSRVRLQEMFDTIKAPLFQFSQHTHFPDLGESFTRFMAENFHKVTKRRLEEGEAWAGFELLGRSPGLFRDAITATVMRGLTDFMGICHEIRDGAESRADMIGMWSRLKPLEQLVVQCVLAGEGLYTEGTRTKLAQAIGVDEVTNNQVQSVVNRLLDEQILFFKQRGKYEIEDAGFKDWLTRHLSELPMSDPK
jgi:hypothetical protein